MNELTRYVIFHGLTGIAEASGRKAKLIEQARLVQNYTLQDEKDNISIITCW